MHYRLEAAGYEQVWFGKVLKAMNRAELTIAHNAIQLLKQWCHCCHELKTGSEWSVCRWWICFSMCELSAFNPQWLMNDYQKFQIKLCLSYAGLLCNKWIPGWAHWLPSPFNDRWSKWIFITCWGQPTLPSFDHCLLWMFTSCCEEPDDSDGKHSLITHTLSHPQKSNAAG